MISLPIFDLERLQCIRHIHGFGKHELKGVLKESARKFGSTTQLCSSRNVADKYCSCYEQKLVTPVTPHLLLAHIYRIRT